MQTSTYFWVEIGFRVESDLSEDELREQLVAWAEEYHTLEGFRPENGEASTVETVHFDCGD